MSAESEYPDAHYNNLLHLLSTYPSIALAFSGGIDSRFLASSAKKAGCRLTLLHLTGPHVSSEETLYAQQWAAREELPFITIHCNPLAEASVAENGHQRCYYCKKKLFTTIRQVVEATLAKNNLLPTICDGSNSSDFQMYRPGLKALHELNIFSPLAASSITKQMVYILAARTGLDNPSQKARPCLLTRFAYNTHISEPLLHKVAQAEAALAHFFVQANMANTDFRLRIIQAQPRDHLPTHTHTELHLSQEVSLALMPAIQDILLEEGFMPTAIRTMEKISGYYDTIPEPVVQVE